MRRLLVFGATVLQFGQTLAKISDGLFQTSQLVAQNRSFLVRRQRRRRCHRDAPSRRTATKATTEAEARTAAKAESVKLPEITAALSAEEPAARLRPRAQLRNYAQAAQLLQFSPKYA